MEDAKVFWHFAYIRTCVWCIIFIFILAVVQSLCKLILAICNNLGMSSSWRYGFMYVIWLKWIRKGLKNMINCRAEVIRASKGYLVEVTARFVRSYCKILPLHICLTHTLPAKFKASCMSVKIVLPHNWVAWLSFREIFTYRKHGI